MRYLAPIMAIFCLFPCLAAAQDYRASCSSYSEQLKPIFDNINRLDRDIGTSSGNAGQRKALFKNYDALMASYQSLEKTLLDNQNGSICTVNAGAYRQSMDGLDRSLRSWFGGLSGKNGLSKNERREMMNHSSNVQQSIDKLRAGMGTPQVGPHHGGPQHPGPNFGGPQPGPNFGGPQHPGPNYGGQPGVPQGHHGMMPPMPPQPQNRAMAQQTFDTLKDSIRKTSSDDGKTSILRAAVANAYLTTAQENELLGLYTFESSKLDVLGMIHPKVIDPENAFVVYGHFNNSDFNKLRDIVEANRPRRLYSLSSDGLDKAKQTLRKVVFSSSQKVVGHTITTFYQLTCAQLIELMKSMNDDDAKIELAVTAYSNLADRESWFTVYNALTFESSKTTLEKRVGIK